MTPLVHAAKGRGSRRDQRNVPVEVDLERAECVVRLQEPTPRWKGLRQWIGAPLDPLERCGERSAQAQDANLSLRGGQCAPLKSTIDAHTLQDADDFPLAKFPSTRRGTGATLLNPDGCFSPMFQAGRWASGMT